MTSSSESERESTKSADAVSWEPEVRAAWSVWAHIGPLVPADPKTITVFIRLEDHINRQVVKQNCCGYRKFLSQSGIKKKVWMHRKLSPKYVVLCRVSLFTRGREEIYLQVKN